MDYNWKKLSKIELEKNYNPRESVANFSTYIEEYKNIGKKSREELPCILEVSYGHSPLQKVDIFGKKNLKKANVHIFIHGGYWRALDKSDHSQLAKPFVKEGILYFSVNHDLCPNVSLSKIVQQITNSIIWIYNNCEKYGGNPDKISISGHSAGAHLCAMMLSIDWSKFNVPTKIIKGVVLISGIYEPEIVLNLSVNEEIKLSKQEALRNTPTHPINNIQNILICVGGEEPKGWIEQTKLYAKKIVNKGNNLDFSILKKENHFSLMISFSNSNNTYVKKIIHMAKNI